MTSDAQLDDQTHHQIAARLAQAIVLYLVGGLFLYSSVLVDAAKSDKGFSVGWYLETVVMWPTEVKPTGMGAVVGVVFGLFAAMKVVLWLTSRFQGALARVAE